MSDQNPWIVDPATAGATRRLDLEVTVLGEVRPLWVDVKTLLSIGEHRKMLRSVAQLTQVIPRTRGEEVRPEAKLEWTEYSFARMEAYITDWSLATDPTPGYRLKPCRASYEKLRQEVFAVIDEALDQHEQRVDAEKKATPSGPLPEAMSA